MAATSSSNIGSPHPASVGDGWAMIAQEEFAEEEVVVKEGDTFADRFYIVEEVHC